MGTDSELSQRLAVALDAVESAGSGLMRLRGKATVARYLMGDPYKTSADRAAEAWIVEFLRGSFPDDAILAEEGFDQQGAPWSAPRAFWAIDALDGTASFIDGFDGFCVQVAWVVDGVPLVGVVHEPVPHVTHWATRGGGAWRNSANGTPVRLNIKPLSQWPAAPVFIDSTPPKGVAGAMARLRAAQFFECGGTGVKICRIAEGRADVLAKPVRYKLWDIAPGELILSEAGGRLGMWDGSPVDYSASQIWITDLVAAPSGLFELAVRDLAELSGEHR